MSVARSRPVVGIDDPDTHKSRAFHLAYAAAGAMFFIYGMCLANWFSRIPTVRKHFSLDDRELGLLLLAPAIGSILAMRWSDFLIGRLGSRNLTVAAGSIFAVCLVGPGIAPVLWLLVAALLLAGAASGLVGVSMNVQAVNLERRFGRRILSSFHGVFCFGSMVGAGMGAVALRYELGIAAHLGLVAALAVTGLVMSGSFLPADRGVGEQRDKKLRLTRPLLFLAALVFCSFVAEGAMADWTAVYLVDVLDNSPTTAALGYGTFATAMLLGRLGGDFLASRIGDAKMLRLAGALILSGLGGGLWLNTTMALFVGIALLGVGLSIVVPTVFRAASLLPSVSTNLAIATLASLGYSGFLIGPPLIGFIAHTSSLRVGLGVVALLGVPVVALAPVVGRAQPITGVGASS